MVLDLKALEQALTTIGNVGKGEITFSVDDVAITLRMLTADEEIAVSRFASEANDEAKEADGPTFLERYKRSTLSYSITQVGALDLRGVDSIPTGEVTEAGVPVRVQKHIAVRKIVDGWARAASLAVFQKYLELIRRVDAEAERAVKFVPGDIDTEIDRVQKRLDLLKKEKEREEGKKSAGSQIVAAVADADRQERERLQLVTEHAAGQAVTLPPPSPTVPDGDGAPPTVTPPPASVAAAPTAAPVPPPAPTEPQPRQRVGPQVSAPPPRPVAPPPAPAPVEPIGERGFDGIQDSLGDGDDAIAAETARIQAARIKARQVSRDSVREMETAVIPGRPTQRTPPHRAAANTADAVLDAGGNTIEAARPVGTVAGKEAYRLPAENLTDRGRKSAAPSGPAVVNQVDTGKPNNPRFRGQR